MAADRAAAPAALWMGLADAQTATARLRDGRPAAEGAAFTMLERQSVAAIVWIGLYERLDLGLSGQLNV